jgi:hypothetical protein
MLASLSLSEIVLTAASTDSFTPRIGFPVLHEVEFCSVFEGLKATLTDDGVGNAGCKISNFNIGRHSEWRSCEIFLGGSISLVRIRSSMLPN